MAHWFEQTIVATGRLSLFCLFIGMIVGFVFIRTSTRLIRAQVRWWPGNVAAGGVHIHHAVFGVVMMLLGGVAGFAVDPDLTGWRAASGALFGVGAALVLDEFALILRLRDVYWSAEGRSSISALFVTFAVTGLLLLGARPDVLNDFVAAATEGGMQEWLLMLGAILLNLGLAVITVLKGKLWTGIIGLYLPPLLIVGATRLSRPRAPWARWRYHRSGDAPARKLARATKREQRFRQPIARAGTWLTELIAGRPDPPATS
ncbi:hypothetical protein [Allosalinactinospora lopnorensis]|uniref:hypothetical protein n=1 Tax=Allosalinactinospora lopnorensis TaxID=1352348 RepID=UPI000623DA8F|nr:hypothetical protein [Allosalinactinospora lopnorensis]